MSRTTSNIAWWVLGVVVVLLWVSCVNNAVNDSGCAQNIGACLVDERP